MKNIGTYAFCFCKALREIYCYAEETPDIDNYTFVGVDASSVMLVVPEGAVEKYKAHPVWGQFLIETPTRLNPAFSEREEATFVYDLTGRRLSKAQRGVNIVGGKKVVVK